jgi:DNA-binding Lrp family transcriptional regulator
MSQARYSIIPTAALEDDRLSAQDLRILATLGSFLDKNYECFPSQAVIAERAKCSRQTVNKSLQRLGDFGYILVIGSARGGLKRALRYRVILDVNLDDIEAGSPVFSDVKKGDIDVVESDNDVKPMGDIDVAHRATAKEDTHKKIPTQTARGVSEQILALLPPLKRKMAPKDSLPKLVGSILKHTTPESLLAAVRACYSTERHIAEDGQYAPAIFSWLKDGVWKNWIPEQAVAASDMTDAEWATAMRHWVETGDWLVSEASPAPDQPGCKAPAKMLRHAARLRPDLADSLLANLKLGAAA